MDAEPDAGDMQAPTDVVRKRLSWASLSGHWWTVSSYMPAAVVVLLGAMVLTAWRGCADECWRILVVVVDEPGGAQRLFTMVVWLMILRQVVRHTRRRLPVRGDSASLLTSPWERRALAARRTPVSGDVTELARRAGHEAAHMVVALAMGRTPVAVDVRSVGGRGGSCVTQESGDMSIVDAAWSRMVTALAGNVVDLAAGVRDQASARDVHQAYQDAAVIVSCGIAPAGYTGALGFDDLLLSARRTASAALERHHLAVQTLTEQLLETDGRTTLEAEDFADVVAMVVGSTAAIGLGMQR